MKRSKFTEAQIAFILQHAEEGTAIGKVCRKAGISESNLLLLAQEVRWPHAVRGEAAAFDELAVRCQSNDRPTTTAPVEPGRLS